MNVSAERKAYKRFIREGMTPQGACGLIGNLEAESDGFYTNRVEYLCLQRLKENGKTYTDKSYTQAVNKGQISRAEFLNPLPGKQYGYGLAQWTSPGRKAGLYDLAKERGVSIAKQSLQIDFLMQELKNSYQSVLKVLKTTNSIREASDIVLTKFECPADCGESVKASRAQRGQKFYDNYVQCDEERFWEATKKLMDEQVGYLEKSSDNNLDNKTGNSGYGNYTKYARDINNLGLMGCQGQPWCAVYQFWICWKIFGKEKALEIMGNGFYNCNSVKAHAKAKGSWHSTPKLGALPIFRNGSHIGRVIAINGNTILTNEGNTSDGGLNNVEANGGCVAEKSYTIGNSQIDGYVWIDYGEEITEPETPWKATGTATSAVDNLFVRAEPNGEIIGELMKGNRFEINGVTSGAWTQVNVANIGVGWVWTAYTKKDCAQAADPPKEEITNKQDKRQRLFIGKVTASVLNVRTWAGTEYPQIKSYPTLNRGNLVDVMNYTQKANDGSEWYYIRIAGKFYGFVSASYIQKQ